MQARQNTIHRNCYASFGSLACKLFENSKQMHSQWTHTVHWVRSISLTQCQLTIVRVFFTAKWSLPSYMAVSILIGNSKYFVVHKKKIRIWNNPGNHSQFLCSPFSNCFFFQQCMVFLIEWWSNRWLLSSPSSSYKRFTQWNIAFFFLSNASYATYHLFTGNT